MTNVCFAGVGVLLLSGLRAQEDGGGATGVPSRERLGGLS